MDSIIIAIAVQCNGDFFNKLTLFKVLNDVMKATTINKTKYGKYMFKSAI